MARETLDRKIRHLLDEILVLDSLVEAALIESVEALKKRDLELARQVYAGDTQINAKRFELENDIIITIATTQPVMAGDLRLIASILEVVGELERIGDYAKGIARIALRMGNQPPVKPLIDIPRMVEIAVDMLHRAVTAFVTHDAETARLIPQEDDQVDDLYNQIYRELVAIMLSDPTTIDRAIRESKLGLNPSAADRSIRVPIPELSEERRRDMVKLIKQLAEEAKVRLRAARKDGMDTAKKLKAANFLTEDGLKDFEDEVQDLTKKFTKKIDDHAVAKEADLMKV